MPKYARHLERLKIPALWRKAKGKDVVVALLDSGVSVSRALPRSRVSRLDSAGRPDVVTNSDHGTNCAGIIAAQGSRTRGVAPAAKILSYNVTYGDGTVSSAKLIEAVEQAIRENVDLISCSLGTNDDSNGRVISIFEKAIDQGIAVFGAAEFFGKTSRFPDAVDGAIVVGPLGDRDEVVAGAGLSPKVNLMAQGHDLVTVDSHGRRLRWPDSRTSGATALAAGVGALVLSAVPSRRRRAVSRALLDLMRKSGRPLPSQPSATILQPRSLFAAVEAL